MLLYEDLEHSFRYVSPTKDHFEVYSLRYYELFIRASTEFESICKEKVIKHKLSKLKPNDFSIKEYFMLNAFFEHRPGKTSIGFKLDEPLFVTPLAEWNTTYTLKWYKDYNEVKHNRVDKFHLANLGNVLNSIAALFIIINYCGLCPKGRFSYIAADDRYGKISSNDEWPILLRKDYEE